MNNISKKNVLKNLWNNDQIPNSSIDQIQLKRNQPVCGALNFSYNSLLQNDLFIEKSLLKKANYVDGLYLDKTNISSMPDYSQFLDGMDEEVDKELSIIHKIPYDLSSTLQLIDNDQSANFVVNFCETNWLGTSHGLLSSNSIEDWNQVSVSEYISGEAFKDYFISNDIMYLASNKGIYKLDFLSGESLNDDDFYDQSQQDQRTLYIHKISKLIPEDQLSDTQSIFISNDVALIGTSTGLLKTSLSNDFDKNLINNLKPFNNITHAINDIVTLSTDDGEKIILAGSNRIYSSNNSYAFIGLKGFNLFQNISSFTVNCLLQDQIDDQNYKHLYVGSNDGVYFVKLNNLLDIELSSKIENITGNINSISKFNEDIYVCGNNGLWKIDSINLNSEQLLSDELKGKIIYTVLHSKNKLIIGTNDSVYWVYDGLNKTVHHIDDNQLSGSILKIIENSNGVYAIHEKQLIELSLSEKIEQTVKKSLDQVFDKNLVTVYSNTDTTILGTDEGFYNTYYNRVPVILSSGVSHDQDSNDQPNIEEYKLLYEDPGIDASDNDKIGYIISNKVNKIKDLQLSAEVKINKTTIKDEQVLSSFSINYPQYDLTFVCTSKGSFISKINNQKIYVNINKSPILYGYDVLDCACYGQYLVFLVDDENKKRKLAAIPLKDQNNNEINSNNEKTDEELISIWWENLGSIWKDINNYLFCDAENVTSLGCVDVLYALIENEDKTSIKEYNIFIGLKSELKKISEETLNLLFFDKFEMTNKSEKYYIGSFKDEGLRFYNTDIGEFEEDPYITVNKPITIDGTTYDNWFTNEIPENKRDYLKMIIAEINYSVGVKNYSIQLSAIDEDLDDNKYQGKNINITKLKNIPGSIYGNKFLFVDQSNLSTLNIYDVTNSNFRNDASFEPENPNNKLEPYTRTIKSSVKFNSNINDLEYCYGAISKNYSPDNLKDIKTIVATDNGFKYFKAKSNIIQNLSAIDSSKNHDTLNKFFVIPFIKDNTRTNLFVGNADSGNLVFFDESTSEDEDIGLLTYVNGVTSSTNIKNKTNNIALLNYEDLNYSKLDFSPSAQIKTSTDLYLATDIGLISCLINFGNNKESEINSASITNFEVVHQTELNDFSCQDVCVKGSGVFFCGNYLTQNDGVVGYYNTETCAKVVSIVSQIENPRKVVSTNKYLYILGDNGLFRTEFNNDGYPFFEEEYLKLVSDDSIDIEFIESYNSDIIVKEIKNGTTKICVIYDTPIDSKEKFEILYNNSNIGKDIVNIFKSYNTIRQSDQIYLVSNNKIYIIDKSKNSDNSNYSYSIIDFRNKTDLKVGKLNTTAIKDIDVSYYYIRDYDYEGNNLNGFKEIYFTNFGIFNQYYDIDYTNKLSISDKLEIEVNGEKLSFKDLPVYSIDRIKFDNYNKISEKEIEVITDQLILIGSEKGVLYSPDPTVSISKYQIENELINNSKILDIVHKDRSGNIDTFYILFQAENTKYISQFNLVKDGEQIQFSSIYQDYININEYNISQIIYIFNSLLANNFEYIYKINFGDVISPGLEISGLNSPNCLHQFNDVLLLGMDDGLYKVQSKNNISRIGSYTNSVDKIYEYKFGNQYLIGLSNNGISATNLKDIYSIDYDSEVSSLDIQIICEANNKWAYGLLDDDNNIKLHQVNEFIEESLVADNSYNEIISTSNNLSNIIRYNDNTILLINEQLIKYDSFTKKTSEVTTDPINKYWKLNNYEIIKLVSKNETTQIKFKTDGDSLFDNVIASEVDGYFNLNKISDLTNNFIATEDNRIYYYNDIDFTIFFDTRLVSKYNDESHHSCIYKISDTEALVGIKDGLYYMKNNSFRQLKNVGENITAISKSYSDPLKGFTQYLVATRNKIFVSDNSDLTFWKELLDFSKYNVSKILFIFVNSSKSLSIGTNRGLFNTYNKFYTMNVMPSTSSDRAISMVQTLYTNEINKHIYQHHNTDSVVSKFNLSAMPIKFNEIDPDWLDMNCQCDNNDKENYSDCEYVINDIVTTIDFNNDLNNIQAKYSNFETNPDNTQSEESWKDIENISTISKNWMSNLKEIYIYLPTTNTKYINHLSYQHNSNIFGKLSDGTELSGNISDYSTKIRILLNKEHFQLDEILDIQINGNSLPLNIFIEKPNNDSLTDEELLKSYFGFNSLILPSVCRTAPFKVKDIRENLNNISGDYMYFDFSCFGTDAQAIRIFGKTKSKYQIKYNSNGGQGTMSNQNLTVCQTNMLNSCNFIKEGYIFKGWSLEKDNNSVDFENNQIIEKDLTTINGKVIELFAVWEKYDFDENSGTVLNISVDNDNSQIILENGEYIHGYNNVIVKVDHISNDIIIEDTEEDSDSKKHDYTLIFNDGNGNTISSIGGKLGTKVSYYEPCVYSLSSGTRLDTNSIISSDGFMVPQTLLNWTVQDATKIKMHGSITFKMECDNNLKDVFFDNIGNVISAISIPTRLSGEILENEISSISNYSELISPEYKCPPLNEYGDVALLHFRDEENIIAYKQIIAAYNRMRKYPNCGIGLDVYGVENTAKFIGWTRVRFSNNFIIEGDNGEILFNENTKYIVDDISSSLNLKPRILLENGKINDNNFANYIYVPIYSNYLMETNVKPKLFIDSKNNSGFGFYDKLEPTKLIAYYNLPYYY